VRNSRERDDGILWRKYNHFYRENLTLPVTGQLRHVRWCQGEVSKKRREEKRREEKRREEKRREEKRREENRREERTPSTKKREDDRWET